MRGGYYRLKAHLGLSVATDILLLNTAVLDLRSRDFAFAERLVGKGGLARCRTMDMPPYTQEQLRGWIEAGGATAGGPGNSAPLMARAGLKVAVGVNLGRGNYGGLDIQGRTFYDILAAHGVDLSEAVVHPNLPTGTTFIQESPNAERGGIAYFPNANNDFDFDHFKGSVERLKPRVVHYMYSGLSDRGDANGGRDLADFMRWCRSKGCITVADSHTLAARPQPLIEGGDRVDGYRLLEPLLLELDIFFTSSDESKLIVNTLDRPHRWSGDAQADATTALDFLVEAFGPARGGTRLAGVTDARGAFEKHVQPDGGSSAARRVDSRFLSGEVVDLVGAGDSFRAGVLSTVARHAHAFQTGKLDVAKAVQMGNLFASLFIKAPLDSRYGGIAPLAVMEQVVQDGKSYGTMDELREALKAAAA